MVLGITFAVLWYVYGYFAFGIVSVPVLLVGIWTLATAREAVPTDNFRLCPQCGYNMTGNTTGQCPECGGSA